MVTAAKHSEALLEVDYNCGGVVFARRLGQPPLFECPGFAHRQGHLFATGLTRRLLALKAHRRLAIRREIACERDGARREGGAAGR
jgi:hypothetical protein